MTVSTVATLPVFWCDSMDDNIYLLRNRPQCNRFHTIAIFYLHRSLSARTSIPLLFLKFLGFSSLSTLHSKSILGILFNAAWTVQSGLRMGNRTPDMGLASNIFNIQSWTADQEPPSSLRRIWVGVRLTTSYSKDMFVEKEHAQSRKWINNLKWQWTRGLVLGNLGADIGREL